MSFFLPSVKTEKVKRILQDKDTSFYFVGIGGVSMSGIAEYLLGEGYTVFGCDSTESNNLSRLRRRGIRILPETEPLPLPVTAVVYTLAVKGTEQPLLDALERGIPILSRAALLGAVMSRFPEAIAVAGTHGKSTVTAMLSAVFSAAGRAPTVFGGAPLSETASSFLSGKGNTVIAEACEYGDSFLSLSPTLAAVLNAEWDHPDYFWSEKALRTSFDRFLTLPSVRFAVTPSSIGYGATFGDSDGGGDVYFTDLSEEHGYCSFVPVVFGRAYHRIRLSVPGEYNVKNACAALLIAVLSDIPVDIALSALEAYRGIPRRMEYKGETNGAAIYDDYAHHPTEIRAAITAAKQMTDGRVITLFQSHTYSRTRTFYADFLSALRLSDRLFVGDIFAARETGDGEVTGERFARDAGGEYVPSHTAAAEKILLASRPGDLILLLGAGNMNTVADLLISKK